MSNQQLIEQFVKDKDKLRLEIGCGSNKRDAQAVGIDLGPADGVDLVGDALETLRLFPDGSADAVYSRHFLEHVAEPGELLQEIARVCADNAEIEIIVPHFSNSFFYSDVTHKSFFGLYSFCYLADSDLFRRKVPAYANVAGLRVLDVQLGFMSSNVWPVRYAIRKAIGLAVNATRYGQEFWEENLSAFISAYEVRYSLIRIERSRVNNQHNLG